jgi:hypothetical protein
MCSAISNPSRLLELNVRELSPRRGRLIGDAVVDRSCVPALILR